jgi:hypothetical protein
MSKDSPPKPTLSKKRFRLLLVGLLVVSIVVIALFGAPLASPFTISKATFAPNTFTPITLNGGFELNDNSWAIGGEGPGVATIVSGGAASGSRSLYIHDPGQSVYAFYNDTSARVLPLLINSSTAFGFNLLFKGSAIQQGTGSVWLTLFLSWRLFPNDTFPLTLVMGNYSVYTDSTFDSVNASAGIIMLRGVRSETSWNNYELQLGTPRVDSLIKGYLQANSSTFYNNGDPIYVVGFRIAADNADAYFDDVALYNVAPSMASVTLSKSTLLPSNLLGLSTYLDTYAENATVSYGGTSDIISFVSDLPMAYNATYQVVVQTGWGSAVYNVRTNDSALPSWV